MFCFYQFCHKKLSNIGDLNLYPTKFELVASKKKFKLYFTRGAATSGGLHLRALAHGQHSFKETSQRGVSDIVYDLTGPVIEHEISHIDSGVLNNRGNRPASLLRAILQYSPSRKYWSPCMELIASGKQFVTGSKFSFILVKPDYCICLSINAKIVIRAVSSRFDRFHQIGPSTLKGPRLSDGPFLYY